MALTKERLEREVLLLEGKFNIMNSSKNFAVNMKKHMEDYMTQVVDLGARIDIIHKQIAEIIREDQKEARAKENAKVPVEKALKKEEIKPKKEVK